MKKSPIIAVMLCLLFFASCSDDDTGMVAPSGNLVLKATVENSATRVGFDTDGSFFWSKNDKIGVTLSGQEGLTEMTLTEGTGKSSATFTGIGTGDIVYAVYPYNAQHKVNGTQLTYNFPASYEYEQTDCDFFSAEKGYGNSFNAPMWGKADNGNVRFRHLGGVLCIKLSQLPIDLKGTSKGTIKIKADQRLTGDYTVSLAEAEPMAVVEDGADEVCITFRKPTTFTDGVFYVPVPTGRYTNLKVFVDGVEKIYRPEVNVGRRSLKILSDAVRVKTVEEANKALEEGKTILDIDNKSLLENVDLVVIPTPDKKPVYINFKGETKNIVLRQRSDADGDKVKQQVFVSFNGNQQNAGMKIKLPNSTVMLSGMNGVNKLSEVTSATANRTLIIAAGVEIDRLLVEEGNVYLEKGGIIHEIQVAETNRYGYCRLTIEEGAAKPEIIGENVYLREGKPNNGLVSTGDVEIISPICAKVKILANPDCLPEPTEYEAVQYGVCYSTVNPVPGINDKTMYNFHMTPIYGKDSPENRLHDAVHELKGSPGEKFYYRAVAIIDGNTIMYGDVKQTDVLPEIVLNNTGVVDLGLSVKWCNVNVGASKPEEVGDIYRFGEIIPYDSTHWKYPYGHEKLKEMSEPSSGSYRILKPEYDVAYQLSDGKYRMPTPDEMAELKEKCTWGDCEYNGVIGKLFIGPNGKYVFLPKMYWDQEDESINPDGYYAAYWTGEYNSQAFPDAEACCLFDGEIKMSSWQNVSGMDWPTWWYTYVPYMVRGVEN